MIQDIIKKYTDIGIIIDSSSLEEKDDYEFFHPIIIVNDDYYIETQGDKTSEYLYGFYLAKKGINRTIRLDIDYDSPEKIKQFIDNFDIYKKSIESKFNRLDYLSKLESKLRDKISEISYFSKYEEDSKIEKEKEYFLSREILNNIYEGDIK